MITLRKNKNYLSGMAGLYYLLIHADGDVNEKEISSGQMMRKYEGIEELAFKNLLNTYIDAEKDLLYKQCVSSLKNCTREDQIRIIAWMTRVANSDGFMDPEEWKLIYQVYYRELNLELQDILQTQKTLPMC